MPGSCNSDLAFRKSMLKKFEANEVVRVYYTWKQNVDGCLRNGSFVRRSANGLVHYMNGDFMGFVDKVPKGMVEVDGMKAKKLIPFCCK